MIPELSTSEATTIITTIVSTATAIATGIFFLRRKWSRDHVEIAKDRAEESVIKHLEEQRIYALQERDRMVLRFDKMDSEKIEMLEKVFRLTSEVETLSGQIKILKEFVARLGTTLDDSKHQLVLLQTENARLNNELLLRIRGESGGGT